MQPCGSDRVREVAGGRILLYSRYPKPWQTRSAKTNTSPEHPGTALFWEEAIFEVVSAEAQQGGGVRYVLEPWRDEHAMRVTDRYDEESEAHRLAQHNAALRREKHRIAVKLSGFLAGHLPAAIQEELASELGLFAPNMTMMSVAGVLAVVVALILTIVHRYMNGEMILWHVVMAAYLLQESCYRLVRVFMHHRPTGSLIGILFYSMAYAAGWKRGMPPPTQEPKGNGIYIREEHEDTKLRDAFHLREPLVTLLPPDEQSRLAERFDYDYKPHSKPVAVLLLVLSPLGVFTSVRTIAAQPTGGAILSLLCAGGVALEQILRLHAFQHGPAGSVFGILARPMTRRLLG